MPEKKHYVYSARTSGEGLAVINKARGERGWDSFITEAVAAHYNLPLDTIALPPSKFFEEQKTRWEARAAEKAQRKADHEAKAKQKIGAKNSA